MQLQNLKPFVYTAAAMITSASFPLGETNVAFIKDYGYSSGITEPIEDIVLAQAAFLSSKDILDKVWENETDSRWEKFLND